jgi:DNA-binding transcriptional LysR family regulator
MLDIRKIDLNLLVAFEALFDERNVSRAAERLALTQPTVSSKLNRLRQLFDDPLFVRTQHDMLPTSKAESLADPVKALLVEVAVTGLSFDDPMVAKLTFSMAINDYIQQVLVIPFIRALRQQADTFALRSCREAPLVPHIDARRGRPRHHHGRVC